MDVSSLLPFEDLLEDEDMLREKSSSEDSLVVVSFLLLDGGV